MKSGGVSSQRWTPGKRSVSKMDQQVEGEEGQAPSLGNLMVNVEQSCMVSGIRWAPNVKGQILYDLSKIRSNVKSRWKGLQVLILLYEVLYINYLVLSSQ